MERLAQHIEALIFSAEQSISLDEIKAVTEAALAIEIGSKELDQTIADIRSKYANPDLAIELVELAGGYLFLTKKDFHSTVNQLQIHRAKKKLSQAALETLAIIAYRQPITKLEIEQIRGVNCDYTVQKLLEKELIGISGKADTVGKPLLYHTSNLFMDYFGLNSLADLPQLKDVIAESNEIGEQAE
ncbi:MAG: SMC-Scp complex subunit ScpB [Sphingobacteriaceae bacterium]